MDCRETQTLLTAFHDGELPAADRVRVEEHLRGCPECGALLADLARADQAAVVPDPGPAYWDRFNARVMDRVEREADGPRVAVLRPKGGWMRQQLRYLVPAAAAAALVVVVVRYGGMHPVAPTPALDGQVPGQAGMPPVPLSRPPAVPPAIANERLATVTREERDRLADGHGRPSTEAGRDAPGSVAPAAGSPPVTAADGIPSGMQAERKKMAGAGSLMAEQQAADKAESASGMRIAKEPSTGSPCEPARTLAERERFREAEDAQRACLAGDLDEPSREKGLVFLAELLDRQARFAEADAVIAEVDRHFPESRPLDLYRQQRPMVQKQPMTVPVTR
jgi:hypothetical protein